MIQGSNGLPVGHPVGASKYADLFGSIYGDFPLEKQPIPATNGSLEGGPNPSFFQSIAPPGTPTPPSPAPSPGTPNSNNGTQNSAILPH